MYKGQITAALGQANQSSDVFVFTENARSDGEGIHHNAAGNILVEIPVSRETGSQPEKLRQAVVSSQNHQYRYDNGKRLPLKPFVNGRVGRITSLATIPANLVYNGVEQLCTIPYLSFLEKIPLDTALIFRFNRQYWGVLHNFAEFDKTVGMLNELMENGGEEPSNPAEV